MITCHRRHLEARCRERGYKLQDVMPCVVKQDGDQWTIDVDHPAYPRPRRKPKANQPFAVSDAELTARQKACSGCRKLRKTQYEHAYCRRHHDGCEKISVGRYSNALLAEKPWCKPWKRII